MDAVDKFSVSCPRICVNLSRILFFSKCCKVVRMSLSLIIVPCYSWFHLLEFGFNANNANFWNWFVIHTGKNFMNSHHS